MFRLLAALLLLLGMGILEGQVAAVNGQIEGTVTDPSGAAIPGAAIRFRNQQTGLQGDTMTNDAGLYRFPLLPLGTYRLSVNAPGFGAQQRENIVVNAGAVATVNIALGVGTQTNVVQVSDAAPVVDPSRTDVGFTLSRNSVENLPLISRNPYNFILVQPNVAGHPNTEFGVPRKVNANGFVGRINYQIDGGNNTESDRTGIRLTPFSDTFVDQVQSVTNAYAPEFGNTVGTIFNTITKSGTNDWHGEGAYLFRRTGFSARPKLLRATAPTPDTNVDTFFGNVGGRIIPDKLFFFAGAEHVKRDLPQVVTVQPSQLAQLGLPASFGNAIPFSQSVLFFLGKVDWQINANHRLAARFNGHRNDSPNNNGGGLTVISQTYNFIDRSYAGSLQLVSSLTPVLVNELRLQTPYRLQRQLPFAATGTGPAITVSGVANFGGSPNVNFLYKEVTPELTDDLTLLAGTHSVKFGLSYRALLDRQTQANAATYTFPSLAAYLAALSGSNPFSYSSYAAAVNQPSIVYNSAFYGLFAQDEWKVRPHVTLTYGIRYDLFDLPAPNRNAPYSLSRDFNVDHNNVGPRVGVAWGLGKEQRTVIRVAGGVFYDPPQTDVYRRALLQTGALPLINYTVGPTGSFAPAFPQVLTNVQPRQDVTSVARDFANLYSLNGNASITRELTANMALTASYFYTRGNRIPVYRNVNLLPTGTQLADGRPIFRSTGYINPQFGNVLVDESAGQSVYHALNVSLNRRLTRGFELLASYTWSHAIDDAPEQNNIDSASQLPADPTNRRRDRGNSLADRRHAFTASGVWQPVFAPQTRWLAYLARNNQISAIFTAYAGDVFNIGSNQVLNGDQSIPASLQRPLYFGRNTYLGPPLYQLDVRYTRDFPIGERVRAQFLGEFTNILNHDNITALNTTARVNSAGVILTPPSFAWTTALDQRLVQFGVRARF